MRAPGRLLAAALAAAAASAASAAADTPTVLANVQSMTCAGATCSLVAATSGGGTAPLRLAFYAPAIVRWWLAVDGNFSDTGTMGDVIVLNASTSITVALADRGDHYEVTSPASAVVARVQKAPALLTLLVGGAVVAQEAAPLAWNSTSSWQTLARDVAARPAGEHGAPPGLSSEYFFGGGMQNGRWSHRGESITIGADYNWEDNGHPNSAPWYVSTAGVGVLRNTWAPGVYAFDAPVVTAHNESTRLDAFFLLATGGGGAPASPLKELLGLYTQLTGPPMLPPLYGLFLGDSDCYHNDRHGNSTRVAISVAQAYVDNDMPRGCVGAPPHGWVRTP